ncbi:hypothetical protein TIFTF001_008962 [Ficus carica]|uniref:Ribosomal protein S13 n=1 Tax=Ficus carica TaxID=3494 RepID=A0AA87ZTW9_FICCA|nr:hypothetical protein TIFTF001_008962 [Ficus carica]
MFGIRGGSASIFTNIRHQILQSLSNRWQRAETMFVKAGMEIPDEKRLEYALPYIHGIGRARARQILSDLSLENKRVRDLTKREVFVLGEELSKYAVERELRMYVERDVRRLVEIQCYRGMRHSEGLPCRGQRTKTNARTKKNQSLPMRKKK